jgi:23S rRNA pseudouridine2457 synthase
VSKPGAATKPRVILFNKPCGVLSQFTAEAGRPGLAGYIALPGIYAAGRLDADSEGLLVLTDDGTLQHRLSDPRRKVTKTYWAQVEGIPDESALKALESGLDLGDVVTLPCRARRMAEPRDLWPRDPPIRSRREIPTAWIELCLREGKNRQVRRMTARVGYPTLRLIRWAVGTWTLAGLGPGCWRDASTEGVAGTDPGQRTWRLEP